MKGNIRHMTHEEKLMVIIVKMVNDKKHTTGKEEEDLHFYIKS